MRALILEDDKERHKQFKQRMLEIGCVYDLVETASSAIDLLKTKKYDIIFLDHDLGGEVYVSEQEKNTGSEVARYLNQNTVQSIVIIHSLNPSGSEYMQSLIPGSHRIPFVWTFEVFHKYVKASNEN
jgi:CheY-like chemotaxis protein